MPIGDIGTAPDTHVIDATMGMWPALTHISGSLFLVCYRGPSGYGIAKSYLVDAHGNITEPANNELTFISVVTNDHYSVLRPPNIVADVYQIADASANLEAIIVASDGTLSQHAAHRCNVIPNIAETMNPVLMPDSIFACAHGSGAGYIYIATGSVAENGAVGASALANYQATAFLSDTCSICDHVDGMHVFVYSDASAHKYAQSVNISALGVVSATEKPAVKICALGAYRCNVIKMKPTWFILVARGAGNDGYAVVFKCLNDGTVSIPTNNVHTIENASCVWPRAIRLSDDVFAVVYTTASSYGKIKTFRVGTGAAATWSELADHTFTGVEMQRVKIALRDSKMALLAGYDTADAGILCSLSLESEAPTLGHHELMMGIGP